MRVASVRTWLGLKVMTVLAAVHLAYMASSQINGTCTCGQKAGSCLGRGRDRSIDPLTAHFPRIHTHRAPQ
jgi:hypothetical protein